MREKIDLNGAVLMISARSPFARRVRLAFRERGVPYRETLHDVLRPNAEVNAQNPIGRVPTLILRTGETVFESGLILSLLEDYAPGSLDPDGARERLDVYRWSATATGLMDKTIEYFFESLRTPETRDPEWLEEIRGVVERVLASLEALLAKDGRTTLLSRGLTQADLDLGTALAYLSLRYPLDWKPRYPRAAAYLARLEERPSFRATVPPAP